jgi:UPF0716 protein FxsA
VGGPGWPGERPGGHTPSLEGVFALLLVLFIAVPAAELYVILVAADTFGVLETVAALVIIGFAGAWLCKQQGFAVLSRIQTALNEGRIPTRDLQNGGLILLAGALLLTPGFLGDVVGILLLLPPTRAIARTFLARALRGRLKVATAAGPAAQGAWFGGVVDVDGRPRDDRRTRDDDGPIPLGP